METKDFLAHHGVMGMHWGKHLPGKGLHESYTAQQIKRDRQLYGAGGVKRINKALHNGDSISVARGTEVTRRNSTLNRNKVVRPLGKGVGAVAGGVAANVAIHGLHKLTTTRSGAIFVAKIFGANSNGKAVFNALGTVDSIVQNPRVRVAVTAGAAYIGNLLGGDAAVSINTRGAGYNPNRK